MQPYLFIISFGGSGEDLEEEALLGAPAGVIEEQVHVAGRGVQSAMVEPELQVHAALPRHLQLLGARPHDLLVAGHESELPGHVPRVLEDDLLLRGAGGGHVDVVGPHDGRGRGGGEEQPGADELPGVHVHHVDLHAAVRRHT